MTKLDFLNAFFTERLMVAAGEIFQVVKSTISEYQEEIDRTKEENRYLRQRLAEVGNNGQSRPDSISSHIHGAPLVQHPSEQQEQIPGQVQMDSETSSPKVKQELGTTLQDSTQQESVTSASTCSTAFVKTADEELPHCLLKKTTNTDKREDEPLFTEADIKIEVEPDRMDCGVSEPICGPQPICSLNPESAAIQSESVSGYGLELLNVDVSSQSSQQYDSLFDERSCLMAHVQSHLTEGSIVCCKICSKSFPSVGQLNAHMHMHIKPYNCLVCGKYFSCSAKFKVHQRIHTGEKPYRCNVCGKCFSQSAHLKVHLRVHTGEKPYSCPLCGRRFSQSSQIKVHLRTHSRGQSLA